MARTIMSITLLESGEEFRLWESFNLTETFLDPLGNFQLSASPPASRFKEYFDKLRKGVAIQVRMSSDVQFTGVIVDQKTQISRNGATISITAQSFLAAAYEASVSPRVNLSSKRGVPAIDLVKKVMGPFFPQGVHIENNAGLNLEAKSGKPISGLPAAVPVEPLKAKDLKAQQGETTYGFCSRILSRLGLILKTDAHGGLMLDRPIYDSPSLYTLVQSETISGDGNYMLDGIQISDTNKGQFSEIVVSGQARVGKGTKGSNKALYRTVVVDKGPPLKEKQVAVTQSGGGRANKPIYRVYNYYTGNPYDDESFKKYEPDVAPYRNVPKMDHREVGFFTNWVLQSYEDGPITFSDRHVYRSDVQKFKPRYREVKSCHSVKQCMTYAGLMFGLKNASGFTVRCSVDGFYANTGRWWTPNTIVTVKIDYLGINEDMWIFGRTFRSDRSTGQVTDLTLMPLDSLVLGKIPS